MKFTRIILLVSIFLCSVYAQLNAQYLGGSGDGYASGTSEGVVLAIEDIQALGSIPEVFKLYQNYPNPFNPTTIISYSILESDFVSLKIYNILGKEIFTLVNEHQTANTYNINFNATELPSGIYLYRIQVGENFNEIKKMIFLK